MKKILLIAVLSAITTACSNKKETETLDKTEVQTTEVTADPNEMLGKQWRLKELNGTPIVLDSTFEKYPFIKFNDIIVLPVIWDATVLVQKYNLRVVTA